MGFSTPLDAIAILLHRLVRPASASVGCGVVLGNRCIAPHPRPSRPSDTRAVHEERRFRSTEDVRVASGQRNGWSAREAIEPSRNKFIHSLRPLSSCFVETADSLFKGSELLLHQPFFAAAIDEGCRHYRCSKREVHYSVQRPPASYCEAHEDDEHP